MDSVVEYSQEERGALKGIFDLFDANKSGFIQTRDLGAILEKIGRSSSEGACG